MRKEDGGEGS